MYSQVDLGTHNGLWLSGREYKMTLWFEFSFQMSPVAVQCDSVTYNEHV